MRWKVRGTRYEVEGTRYEVADNTSHLAPRSQVTLIPNPTTGQLIIDNGQLTIENVEVFDIYGRKLLSNHLITSSSHHLITSHPAPRTSLNISHLPVGMYFVKISTDTGMVVKKVVKQ